MHLADAFIHIYSGYKKCYQYVCYLGIEPTNFCAANAMLYHWATGTEHRFMRQIWEQLQQIKSFWATKISDKSCKD